jgi:hypothetical protein
MIFGANLGLDDRTSFRNGISKWYAKLSEAHKLERSYCLAISSASQALKLAPKGYKRRAFLRISAALLPSIDRMKARLRRLIRLTRKSIGILKEEGPKVLLSRVQSKLAGKN